MKVEDIKWYSPLEFFVGAIFSFADPITDIFTLMEFYRTDHKTWFGVGLAFVLFPCLVFPVLFFHIRLDDANNLPSRYAKTAFCAFHPFSAAFARIEASIFCLKIRWFGSDEIDKDASDKAENLLDHIAFAVLFEAVLESAPQFIIQLYAMSVQEEPVAYIQMISLPVSFFTLAWAFTATDEDILIRYDIISSGSELKVKHKVALYTTQLLLLSSRLFAICYFTVSYKCYYVKTWYCLPVTVCVCVISVVGSTMRTVLLYWLWKKATDGSQAANSSDANGSNVNTLVD
ncbi:uncharacterized protein LOC111331230 isoform X2 [Stylophora pistillata]|uniref:XK-related protein n=1 Tax=Stylophora pistillata TaxID=50429 RepID=A0A2B4S7F1_STYPI|nr:uncharacterized protein LOC111331230 isoform X2 [Stylophora pistillata]PFX24740.1 hypothetical protein AWC38_SpisGene10641 [Stylophora pistillata]